MTQLGGRQWAQVRAMLSAALASAVPAEVRGEPHLAAEAVAAYVDGELSLAADQRATRHLARCTLCTAEVAAQRQARAAVRGATAPAMPSSLLAALHAIPHSAELPPAPDGLAVNAHGEFTVAQRSLARATPLGMGAPLGSGVRLGSTGLGSSGGGRAARRAVQGAGVVVSGLVLGALALALPAEPATTGPRPGADSGGAPQPVAPASFEFERRIADLPAERPLIVVGGLPQR